MFKKIVSYLCGLLIISFCMGYFLPQQNLKDRRVEIKKIGKEWKVLVDSSEVTPQGKRPELKVKNGQKIIWTITGSDAYFQFTIDSLFEGNKKYKYSLKDGKELKLTIKKHLSYDEIYAIFVVKDNEFASQDSPPKIIVVR